MADIKKFKKTDLSDLGKNRLIINDMYNNKADIMINTIENVLNIDLDDTNQNKNNQKQYTDDEKKQIMIQTLGLDEREINRIDYSGEKINIYLDNDIKYIVDKNDYSLEDVVTDMKGFERSVVKDIDMYSLDSEFYDLYGGNQGDLSSNSDMYVNNITVSSIIDKYYPNENYTEEDLKLLFARMNNNGCGYVAGINCAFELTKNLTDDEFYNKFGFDRYTITHTSSDEYVKTYNYNAMFLDFYLYYQKDLGFNSIKDIYGDIEIGAVDGAINGDFDSSGSTGARSHDAAAKIQSYLSQKDINMTYEKVFHPKEDFISFYSPMNDHSNYETVKKALDEGDIPVISMNDFTMYYPEDIDGNGLLDDVKTSGMGAHGMTVTDINDDGDYIVSSWGNEYIVRPKSESIYNSLEDLFNGEADADRLYEIIIYDTSN